MTNAALRGKLDAGNPHVRFDEGEVASAATPRRGSLLYKKLMRIVLVVSLVINVGAIYLLVQWITVTSGFNDDSDIMFSFETLSIKRRYRMIKRKEGPLGKLYDDFYKALK